VIPKIALPCVLVLLGFAQNAPAQQPPRSPRESAQVDVTGYWVSLITEEWLWRMITPPKGDYASVPINAEARKIADAWDLAKDVANGEQCRPFGAAGLMRLPTRVHITWADDNTLKVETDAGQQTRLFNFDKAKPPGTERTWQGFSLAEWTRQPAPPVAPRGTFPAPGAPLRASMRVVTTNLRPGYLRKNGVPYSDKTLLTEYYDRVSEFGGDFMVITTVVLDPAYLQIPFVTSTHFKREADASKWNPTPCKTDPPRVVSK
jgi:hypothetical protein